MFRVKPKATLSLIFFTVFIKKSEKQPKVLSGCLKNLPSRIPRGKFFQTTAADFPLFIPEVLCVASHHVGLGKLQVGLADPPDLPGDVLADGPGLGELLPVPVE